MTILSPHPLSEPITVLNKKVTELTFSKMSGGTIRRNGSPTKQELTKSGSVIHHMDTEAIAGIIAELANIPPSAVDEISPLDFLELGGKIVNFINQSGTTSSTDTTSSPGSTET